MKLRFFIFLIAGVTPLLVDFGSLGDFRSLLSLCTAHEKQPAKKAPMPHGQSSMPGPPLSPQDALKKMQVPPGFHVELVAAEPDIVNPVAMTFDERGRIWITESIEYPRRSAGPGKDRVKLLESTKGDGKFDKITTVIDGLNIPSGIAIGHGGVWVANAPDILYYPVEDVATAKLGKPQVVVTGFGRHDTHELPNSLTWGPDGWLYGLNGVFNRSIIKQDGKTFDFTCALFRIHPKTKKFEIFCEGTSNPWGLAINENGDFFVSACVIDHLWHLTETGYYQRQGGPYPPYTWKIGSIVKHRHQKAAYCGLVWFDSDAYPQEYREKLYMGNIHGGAINCDQLEKDGSTYSAKPALSVKPQASAKGVGEGSNFLLANDAWFMPVAQKVGPDGCMYILDWYDRYHCYQDANRDPAGIDRQLGRLYRIVYKDYKPAGKFDLSDESFEKLTERLGSSNVMYRQLAQRIITERQIRSETRLREDLKKGVKLSPEADAFGQRMFALEEIAHSHKEPTKKRVLAIGILDCTDMEQNSLLRLASAKNSIIRSWAVRMAGKSDAIEHLADLAKDKCRDVQLQTAIAAAKAGKADPREFDRIKILVDVLAHCGDDKLIPHIVWQNLHPLLEKDGDRFLTFAAKPDLAKAPGLAKVLPRAVDRILGNRSGDPAKVLDFIQKLVDEHKVEPARLCLAALTVKVQNNEITGKQLDTLRKEGRNGLDILSARPKAPLFADAAILLAVLKDDLGIERTRKLFDDAKTPEWDRLRALEALMTARDPALKDRVATVLYSVDPKTPNLRAQVLNKLGKLDNTWVAGLVLETYSRFTSDEKAKAIELLTQRPAWGKTLFQHIAKKNLSKDVVNVNQARRLLATKDAELIKLIEKHWGSPRDSRNPEREKVVAQMKELFKKTPGDPKAGALHFKKICAQCHKIYGVGIEVGPDITSNGRADFDQLLSNIFDPSLVIGAGYQAVIVNTKQGQTLTGLVVEDNKERVVLKIQGGELKTISRADVEEQFTSKLSMMPEDLEKQLRPQEIVDLLEFLSLDRPPDDPKAKRIPGAPNAPRESKTPDVKKVGPAPEEKQAESWPDADAVEPKDLDPKLIAAWKAAGVEVGWHTKVNWFAKKPDFKAYPDMLPYLSIRPFRSGLIAKLPAPDQPFSLHVYGSDFRDANLPELAGLKKMRKLNLSSNYEFTGVGLKDLAELPDLQILFVDHTKLNEASLKEICRIKTLRVLGVGYTSITEARLVELVHLKDLYELDVWNVNLSDIGLEHLSRCQTLRDLTMCRLNQTGAGLKSLSKLTKLETLRMPGLNEITLKDADVKNLGALQNLREVNLGKNAELGDRALDEVAALANLRTLNLQETKVTDTGLRKLATLKNLRHLVITGTKVTEAGVNELKRTNPELKVQR
jgi:putative membrane-bound dehydrogenase-like protein